MSSNRFSLYQRGFTLMEIMVVLAVIGILVAVALPFYRDYVIKATVTDALAVADEGRVPVEIAYATGAKPAAELSAVMGALPLVASGAVGLTWDDTNKAIIARASISGMGTNKPVLALQRSAEGVWICLNAAKVGHNDALEEKYLPASCHGLGTALASAARPAGASALSPPATPAAPACPADQERITLPTGAACTPKCAAGQIRDSANPTRCKDVVCGPNEIKHYDTKLCVTIPPKPTCGPGDDAFRGYDNNNYPNWGCRSACPTGQMPGMAWKCIPDPNAKVPVPAAAALKPTPPAAPAKPAPTGPDKSTWPAGASPDGSIQCKGCDPSVPDLCELVMVDITCTAPNNWCTTFVVNNADGTKVVTRGCGDFERVRREWYLGTSDDDKCRERINVEQHLDFTCTFGCGQAGCNTDLRPAEDSLYLPK